MLATPYKFDPEVPCFMGIDDTVKKDLGCLVYIQFVEGILYVESKFFAPQKQTDLMIRQVRSCTYEEAVKTGGLVVMGDEAKDSDMLMELIDDIGKRLSFLKIEYDNADYSSSHLDEYKKKFGEVFGTDTTPSKTRIATSKLRGLFMRRKIKINPNPLMRYSLSCGRYRISNAGYLQIARENEARENDGLMALLYAFSGIISADLPFFLDKFVVNTEEN